MSWLNNRQYNFEKLALEYNKTLINEMKSVCFPHPPRGYGRSDLLPAYLCALERYYERLKKKNSKIAKVSNFVLWYMLLFVIRQKPIPNK